MVTLVSFILILMGAANWLSIGLMQYDFVAGIFGTQSSMLSRLIYIVIGFGGIWFLFMSLKQKGHIKINYNGFEKLANSANKSKKQRVEENNFHNDYQEDNNYNKEDTNMPRQQERQNYNSELGREIHEQNSIRRRNPFEWLKI